MQSKNSMRDVSASMESDGSPGSGQINQSVRSTVLALAAARKLFGSVGMSFDARLPASSGSGAPSPIPKSPVPPQGPVPPLTRPQLSPGASPSPSSMSPSNGRGRTVRIQSPVQSETKLDRNDLARVLRKLSRDALVQFASEAGTQLCELLGFSVSNLIGSEPDALAETMDASINLAEATLPADEDDSVAPTFADLRALLQSLRQDNLPERSKRAASMSETMNFGFSLVSFTKPLLDHDSDSSEDDEGSDAMAKSFGSLTMVNDYRILRPMNERGRCAVALVSEGGSLYAMKAVPRGIRSTANQEMPRPDSPESPLLGEKEIGEKEIPLDQEQLRTLAILKKIEQRSLVRTHDVIDDPAEGRLFIVSNYIERGVLLQFDERMRCSPIDAEAAVGYMRQLLEALAALHEKAIIHGAIKPSNVLLGSNGRAYLSDFGIGRIRKVERSDPERQTDAALRAPEVNPGEAITAAADVWSLGVIFYAMLFGRLPFHEISVEDTRAKIVDSEPDFELQGKDAIGGRSLSHFESTRRALEDDLIRIVRQMLVKDPNDRPLVGALLEFMALRRSLGISLGEPSIREWGEKVDLAPEDLENVISKRSK